MRARVRESGSKPATAYTDLLLVPVSERVGLARELSEHGVQAVQVEAEELLEVLTVRLESRGVFAPLIAALMQHAPLDVVTDRLEQHVVAVHISRAEVRDRCRVHGAASAGSGARGILHLASHRVVQWHIPQQAGHHHRLVHVVHCTDEARHRAEQRVLLIARVADLHHPKSCARTLIKQKGYLTFKGIRYSDPNKQTIYDNPNNLPSR